MDRRVLLIDLDDIGVDLFNSASLAGRIPNLTTYRMVGQWYTRFWAAPLCSIFRARLLTGCDAYRPQNLVGMLVDETSIYKGPQGPWITTAMPGRRHHRGKWHLSGTFEPAGPSSPGGPIFPDVLVDPVRDGYDLATGPCANLGSYTLWNRGDAVRGGPCTISQTNVYATTSTAQDALSDINASVEFVHVSFNAIHTPYNTPPQNEPVGATYSGMLPDEKRLDMFQHLDYWVGQIVNAALASDYLIFIVCDNGSAQEGKGTMYESGLVTPLIVLGDGVVPGATNRMVCATDLWSTIRYVRGCADYTSAPDSLNFIDEILPSEPVIHPPRRLMFIDRFPNPGTPPTPSVWRRAIRDARYKLILTPNAPAGSPTEEFFDLGTDPDEQVNLLAGGLSARQNYAYGRLLAAMP